MDPGNRIPSRPVALPPPLLVPVFATALLAVLAAVSADRVLGLVTAAMAVVAATALTRARLPAPESEPAAPPRASTPPAPPRGPAPSTEPDHVAAVGTMASVLAHEIRTPLASLKGHAELLVEATEPATKPRARAERVLHDARALEHLVNDLLTFVRSGRLRRDPTDLRLLAEQARDTAAPEATVRAEGDTTAPVDRVRVLQALENLLRNAAQHGAAPIELSLRGGADAVTLEVRDHGKGIPEDRLERVFEPFYTDATRGTGLGLAIVKRVVELHGGRVVARNEAGGGACFVLTLPR